MQNKKTVEGMVFDIQRYPIHDGPGIRSIVFFSGCPMRCAWCSNPESQSGHSELLYTVSKCVLCGLCIHECPKGAISLDKRKLALDRERCDRCGTCVDTCKYLARRISGEKYSAEELLDEILKDHTFFYTSGGGVTLSGGEPLGQGAFAKSFLEMCKDAGLDTAVETSGYVNTDVLMDIEPLIDTFMMDLKHVDDKKHMAATGVSNRLILENWKLLAGKRNVICRVPVIPGFNDQPEEIRAIGQFAKDAGCKTIHLLPYHKYGEGKYAAMGRAYGMPKNAQLPEGHMNILAEILKPTGLEVQCGG